ncbi:hypothetical protein B0H17DRAFT_1148793 [Mycena rosella]|uniref:Uncharacterized protein n=1 Tax=Mycena rosella TaxID=1033263 RepID=A0AAD7C9C4_MYCRO|nr:hypothetical protein B0H17DRAFT_1148793 [Mycena rosella]
MGTLFDERGTHVETGKKTMISHLRAGGTPPGSPPLDRAFNAATTRTETPGGNGVATSDNPMQGRVTIRRPKASGKSRRHKKADGPKDAPGPGLWVWGTKLVFFEKRKDKYLKMAEKKAAGEFYTKISRLYELKYGLELEDDEDIMPDEPDPDDEEENNVVHRKETPEDAARLKAHQKLRSQIRDWYRRKFSRLLKSDKAAFGDLFTGVLDGAPPKPQRPHTDQFYSQNFYQEHMKARFEEERAAIKTRASFTGEPIPAEVTHRSRFTEACWEEEPERFKQEVLGALERQYQTLADSPTKTAEEMAVTFENAGYYLQPFVDTVKQRFGMEAWWEYEGETRGLAQLKWPDWDRGRFQEVETRMLEWGRECFTEADCRARAVGGAAKAALHTPAVSGESLVLAASGSGSNAEGNGAPDWLMEDGPEGIGGSYVTRGAAVTAGGAGGSGGSTGRGGGSAGRGGGGGSADGGGGSADGGGGSADGGGGSADGGGGSAGAQGGRGDGARSEPEGMGATVGGTGAQGGGKGDGAQLAPPRIVDAVLQNKIDTAWKRKDRVEWTLELGRAHAAFARGKAWGLKWAQCVAAFFDFEGAHGYDDAGAQMPVKGRPKQVKAWIARARAWEKGMDLGVLGERKRKSTFIGSWWVYWTSLQPEERLGGEEKLSRPEMADWEAMSKLHGKNGLLQVMLTLLWWGDCAGDETEDDKNVPTLREVWLEAVGDVEWVLRQLGTGERASPAARGATDEVEGGSYEAKTKAEAEKGSGVRKEEVGGGGRWRSC